MNEIKHEKSELQKSFEALAPLQKFLTVVMWIMSIGFIAFIAYHSVKGF